jgi:hypothetical protein
LSKDRAFIFQHINAKELEYMMPVLWHWQDVFLCTKKEELHSEVVRISGFIQDLI